MLHNLKPFEMSFLFEIFNLYHLYFLVNLITKIQTGYKLQKIKITKYNNGSHRILRIQYVMYMRSLANVQGYRG